MEIFDISVPIQPGMITYPGDPLVQIERVGSIEHGDVANLTRLDFGVHTGTLVHVIAAAAGLSAVLAASATAFSVVKYLGAAYLIYLGVRQLRSRVAEANEVAPPAPPRLSRAFVDGFVVNVLNPKTALFFLAFLPQFVTVTRGAVPVQPAENLLGAEAWLPGRRHMAAEFIGGQGAQVLGHGP